MSDDGHLPLGCNSSQFYPNHTGLCDKIGGKWQANISWCEADNSTVLEAMERNGRDRKIILGCKTGFGNAGPALRLSKLHRMAAVVTMLVTLFTMVAGVQSSVIALSDDGYHPNLTARFQPCRKRVDRVGDGNPHSSCRFIQLTDTLPCGAGSCGVNHGQSHTVEWSISSEWGGGKGMFGTAGFGVSDSYTTGIEFICNGLPFQKVCIAAVIDYTEYTAREVVAGGECI